MFIRYATRNGTHVILAVAISRRRNRSSFTDVWSGSYNSSDSRGQKFTTNKLSETDSTHCRLTGLCNAGVLSPSAAFGLVLHDRLKDAGYELFVGDSEKKSQ